MFCLTFGCTIASAQVTGSISGAAIPRANLTVTETATGQVRSVATDDRGTYRVLALPVGRYEVKAEREGFKTSLRTGISLVVAQDVVVDIPLQVGNATQEVAVTAEADLVNVSTTEISGLVNEQQVKDLPLNGRSFDNRSR